MIIKILALKEFLFINRVGGLHVGVIKDSIELSNERSKLAMETNYLN